MNNHEKIRNRINEFEQAVSGWRSTKAAIENLQKEATRKKEAIDAVSRTLAKAIKNVAGLNVGVLDSRTQTIYTAKENPRKEIFLVTRQADVVALEPGVEKSSKSKNGKGK